MLKVNHKNTTPLDMKQDTTPTLEVPDFFRDTVNKNSLCAA